MKKYQELVGIVSRHKRNQIQVIGYDKSEEANQYDTLYNYFEQEQEPSFESAQELLFAPEKRKQFNNLLAGFKRRMINSLFLIDVKKTQFGAVNDAFFNVWKNLAAIKILLRFYAVSAAEDLIKQTIPHAVSTENFTAAAELYQLSSKFAARRGDLKKNKEQFEKFVHFHHKAYQYRLAEQLYLEVNGQAIRIKSFTDELKAKTDSAIEQVYKISQESDSDRIKVYYYLLCNYLYSATKNYAKLNTILQQSIIELKDSTAITEDMKGAFHHFLMINLAVLGRFEESARVITNADKYLRPKSLNWFINKEFLSLIQLYQGNYQSALEIHTKTTNNKEFRNLPTFKRENWVLIEAFLNLLSRIDLIEQTASHKLKRFSYAKFVNEVVENSQDKHGYNITFQILQILFLLQSDNWEETENRIMSTYKYAQRHLKEHNKTQRAFLFISALTQIPRGGFQKIDVAQRAEKWLAQMEAINPMETSDPFEIEIIPYNRLWEITLKLL